MSLQNWKDKYYPLSAEELPQDATLSELLAHAMLKWEGLRPENLAAHDLMLKPGMRSLYTLKGDRTGLRINAATCGLCLHCTCRSMAEEGPDVPGYKPRFLCPLEIIRPDGGDRTCPCDVPLKNEYKSPYHSYASDGDSAPMRLLLQQAAKWLEANPDADEILALEVPNG